MTQLRFLFDECTTPALIDGLRLQEPGIDILRIGDPGAPPSGTLDPDLLLTAEASGRVLVTNDRKTMPAHLTDHFVAGHHTAGVMLLRQGFPLGHYIQEILMRYRTMTADEWIDRTEYIP
jgi:hypothetical protein